MVIYEVNISIPSPLFHQFYEWLIPHIHQILEIKGFQSAEVGLIENDQEEDFHHLRVCYMLDSYDSLQNYLTVHAPNLRQESIDRFNNQAKITRRIILEPTTISKTAPGQSL
jgi:hypothetical protein